MMMRRLALAGLFLALAAPAWAQVAIVDAPTAAGLPGVGGLLVDIRTPDEISKTGLPKGAVAIPLQGDDMVFNKDFVAEVDKAAGGDKKRPTALIDNSGRRAEFAGKLLLSQGYVQVMAVGEGMLGSNMGPGWITRGLPVEK